MQIRNASILSERLLILGGEANHPIEIINLNGNIEQQSVCVGESFDITGATGGLLSNKDVFVCAGYQCYSLSSTGTLVPTLSTDSLVRNVDSLVLDDTLLIVGGEIEPDEFK